MSSPAVRQHVHFHFDPICPFAWITSRWVTKVVQQRGYSVDWRFISLRLVNSDVDYDRRFPAGYEDGHMAGLRMLRVAAAARDAHGPEVVGDLYTAFGERLFDVDPPEDRTALRVALASSEGMEPLLSALGLPTTLAAALDEEGWDVVIQEETDAARERTGKDVGTPIVVFDPPDGPAFFGPVISRIPSDEDAIRLWDCVLELAQFPGFAELKRSLRERPALRALGATPDEIAAPQDWKGGSVHS